jgi:macrolide transport system ATP-binding/permease protein
MVKEPVENSVPLIELRNVRKRYGGVATSQPEVEVLHGIDLTIRAGEFVAIMGASGSGKSTLMHILGCLDRPTNGIYRFDGIDVATLDADALAWLRREAFGFVFQSYHLISSESARENVEVPALYAGVPELERAERSATLLARLGMDDKLLNRPHQLSGGQQQRVSIARALINGGRIILADEPTGALDSQSGAEVMALLRELADAGHTIVLITHDREVASQARRIIEIKDGRIVGDSTVDSDAARDITDDGGPSIRLHDVGRNGGPPFGFELREASRMAWRGMRTNSSRTLLTLLGIVIGVASVIVMLAIGEGAKQRVIAQLSVMGANLIMVWGVIPPAGGQPGVLSEGDLRAIAGLADVRQIVPTNSQYRHPMRFGRFGEQRRVIAVTANLPGIRRWPVTLGRFFSEAEDREQVPVAVVGYEMWQSLSRGGGNPLGHQIAIGSSPFTVIGVMAERGAETGDSGWDDDVFIPYRAGLARLLPPGSPPTFVLVEVASPERVREAEAAIRHVLRLRHGGREDIRIDNSGARLEAEAEARNTMTMMLALIAGVSLLVGGVGVMNVMLMTVRERTREIGIRMATGARQRDIQRQFLTEAVVLTMVGGVIGLLAGLSIGVALIVWNVPIVFSIKAMIGAFACAVATGLIFGYSPARTAARLDPVVALAGE